MPQTRRTYFKRFGPRVLLLLLALHKQAHLHWAIGCLGMQCALHVRAACWHATPAARARLHVWNAGWAVAFAPLRAAYRSMLLLNAACDTAADLCRGRGHAMRRGSSAAHCWDCSTLLHATRPAYMLSIVYVARRCRPHRKVGTRQARDRVDGRPRASRTRGGRQCTVQEAASAPAAWIPHLSIALHRPPKRSPRCRTRAANLRCRTSMCLHVAQ